MRKKRKTRKVCSIEAPRLQRWQKNLIHGAILLIIIACLVIEGAKATDLAFLALSVVTEVS